MLDISLEWLPAIINASLRAVLVAAITWTVLRTFKLRDSNIRHRVWSGVLLGMLCLPVLSGLLPPVPLPFEVQTDWLRALDEPSAALADADQVLPSDVRDVPARRTPNNGAVNASIIPGHGPQWNAASFPPSRPNSAVRDSAIDAVPQVNESQAEEVAAVPAPASRFGIGDLLRAALIVAFAAWLPGMVVLLLRTMTGLITTTVLLRRSQQLHSDRLSMCCAAVLQPFKSGSIRLMCSNEIRVPVTVGCWNPTVLLPATWQQWSTGKLEAVLAHETTHVRRRDFIVAVLAEVNLSVYWFHPMAWWLRRNLADLAEEACDDAAIVLTGNPAGYARHLLEVAAALTHGPGRLVQPGMSMARESNVENRILAILDFTRPLSRQLTWKALAVLLLITVPVIALSAALQPIARGPQSATASGQQAAEVDEADNPGPSSPAVDTTLVFHGTVTDPAGQPFAGAKIYLIYWDHNDRVADPNEKPFAVSGTDGRFEFRIDATNPANGPMPGAGMIVAVANGYSFACVTSAKLETTGRLLKSFPDSQRDWIEKEIAKSADRLQLLEDAPVRGRIVNSEGQGVAGATIRVQEVSEGVGGSLQQWVAATKAQQADYYSSRDSLPTLFNGYTRSHLAVPSVLTNADGWFELRGLGRNRVAEVVISGPAIASSVVNVRADSGKTIRLLEQWPDEDDDRRIYYGNGFTHIAASSQLVTGRVTDRSTGAPLPNCLIQAERLSSQKIGGRMSVGYIRTRTDETGRYLLHGLPLGKCSIVVIPPNDAPYVPLEVGVNKREPAATSERDIEFVRGVLVEGQVTDARTGKPVAGRIEYSASATNDLVKGQHRFWLAYMPHYYRSGPDGRYRIPVLPGPGVLGFTADDHQAYPRARWTPTPNMPARNKNPDVLETLPTLTFAGDYHYVTGINPQSKLESMRLDFQLTSGIDISGHVERPDGSRVDGCTMYGESIPGGWYQHPRILNAQSGFQVQGYRPDRPQRVIAWLEDENLIGTILLNGEQPESVTIRLAAAGSLTGRLVNSDGEPVVRVFLTNGHSVNDSLTAGSGSPEAHGEFPDDSRTKRKLVTDDDGRFTIPGLVPGLVYSANARGFRMIGGEKRIARLGNVFADVVVAAGETKDLGDIVLQEQEE